jgi:hypothetical protein
MLQRGECFLPLLGIEPQPLCHPDRCLLTIPTELSRLLMVIVIMSENCCQGLGDDDILGTTPDSFNLTISCCRGYWVGERRDEDGIM